MKYQAVQDMTGLKLELSNLIFW